ncbi:MAG: pantoate--beta-alanine ligase [Saprospiraceae bacterium]
MLIFKTVDSVRRWLDIQRAQGRRIGFAPTMGALHAGHLSLLQAARNDNACSVASIFVNPTQFNDPEDLRKYPRTPERDIQMLIGGGCEALFMPEVDTVYPPDFDPGPPLDFGPLASALEGRFRPGHFDGMATVVRRLLDIVRPDLLYMGLKDFQQQAIVAEMIRRLNLPTVLRPCPTLREPDGLAMSSRNARLSPEMRAAAPAIFAALKHICGSLGARRASELRAEATNMIARAGLRPEYVEICDGHTLQPVETDAYPDYAVALCAVWAGDVRLIDNLICSRAKSDL